MRVNGIMADNLEPRGPLLLSQEPPLLYYHHHSAPPNTAHTMPISYVTLHHIASPATCLLSTLATARERERLWVYLGDLLAKSGFATTIFPTIATTTGENKSIEIWCNFNRGYLGCRSSVCIAFLELEIFRFRSPFEHPDEVLL